ncbi:MAG: HAD-IG family 5'-nucleotidase [Myxococcaceae bacterium]|nr:HAD-IG family 5'-nucleotidase [Myxococcaceae bacterium]
MCHGAAPGSSFAAGACPAGGRGPLGARRERVTFIRTLPPTLPSAAPIPGGLTPLHGGVRNNLDRRRALEAERRADELLKDPALVRLMNDPHSRPEQLRARQVFVNRNLRMAHVELVGFDMDYTLAIYHMRRIEQLSFDMTLARLVSDYGYPPEIGQIHYDHEFGMRGLLVDKANGNLIKMDRYGYVGRAYHGRRMLDRESWQRLYRDQQIKKREPKYAWIDTLFALPEACMYAGVIELLEGRGQTIDYAKLYDDIREAIDTVHRDGSLKREIRKDLGHYIFKDPELGPALHKLRSAGKKLFVLTNSLWDYTNAVMRYLLDGVLPEYPSWRNYFDFIITGAGKPAFFTETGRPFLEVDTTSEAGAILGEATSLERGKVYQGGNLVDFERWAKIGGEHVLYVGDHIYGDIVKSKKSSLWRTCMIVQEIEDEIAYTDSRRDEIARLSKIEELLARLDDEVAHLKGHLNAVERRLEREEGLNGDRAALEEERRRLKADLDVARRAFREATQIARDLEEDIEAGFNPYWGLMFKEGNENSKFGEQVEQYACLYTSRVSNFLQYSPMHYFRSARDNMAHERAGALSGKLSPVGSEGPPRAANTAD